MMRVSSILGILIIISDDVYPFIPYYIYKIIKSRYSYHYLL